MFMQLGPARYMTPATGPKFSSVIPLPNVIQAGANLLKKSWKLDSVFINSRKLNIVSLNTRKTLKS